MTGPTLPGAVPVLRLVVFAVAVALILVGVRLSRPPHDLTIEVGAVGGSYYENAVRYRDILAARGIDLHIVPQPDSLRIIKDVATPGSGIDIGFTAQDLSAAADLPVATIGLVQLQPMFIFASADLGRRSILNDLRGRRVVTLPSNSASAEATLRVFELYDITPENTSFTFLPLADAVRELRAGRFDAGVFILAPENQVIRDLAADTGLHLVPIPEMRAIAHHLPFLRLVVLPRGIYNIADAVPPNDTPMLAAPVGVVARKGLNPWLVYSLLEAIAKAHRAATLVSDAGDYPTIVGSQMAVDPLAARWYQSGTPWIWRELSPELASFLDRYALEEMGALVFSGIVISIAFLAEIISLVLCAFAWLRRRRAAPP